MPAVKANYVRRRAVCVAVLIAVAAPSGVGGTARADAPERCPLGKTPYEGGSPRFHRSSIDIGGVPYRFTILLPSDYSASKRRYPVLYLFHGGGGHEESMMGTGERTPLIETISADDPVIIVMPDGGFIGGHMDWPNDPGQMWETFHISRLVPHVDATYRTLPGPAHRAAFGFSMGGYGALKYAGRHPGVFGAAGSASGFPDFSTRSPGALAALLPFVVVLGTVCTDSQTLFGDLGDPVVGAERWDRHNPRALVDRMRGTLLFATSGNGVPCDAEDAETVARHVVPDYTYAIEAQLRESNRSFHAALVAAGIDHVYREPACGVHSHRYFDTALRRWWPIMMQFFGESDSGRARGMRLRVRPARVESGRRTTLRFRVSTLISGVRQPVARAAIRMGRHRLVTGRHGEAKLAVVFRRPGRRRVVASRNGFGPGVAYVTVVRAGG